MFGAILAIALIVLAVVAVAVGLATSLSSAGEDADKNFSDKPVAATTESCPEEDVNIVSIAWLNGGDDIEIADTDHWVNLPVEDTWINGAEVMNKDRLGLKPRMKVKFDKEGSHSFKVKLLPPTGTAAYTGTEKGRNANFKYTEDEKSYSTDADGTKVIDDIQVVAGGGYIFQAEATDKKNKKVKTGSLTTKRLIYYVEAKMTGLASVLSATAPIDAEYLNHHIVLKKLAALSIARQENIGSTADNTTLSGNVNTAVDADADTKAKKPYLLTVAYTDHLAVKNPDVLVAKDPVDVGPGKPNVIIPITARSLLSPNAVATKYLWHDIVAGESWFVEAKFYTAAGVATTIPPAKVTTKGTGNYWNEVEVDVTGLPAASGKVEVKVNVIDRMRAGLALSGANQTCVCTRAWWTNQPDSEQQGTIIHEMGHKVGMVADETGNLPDKTASQYSGCGHAGSHCHKGCPAGEASYNTTANVAASGCVLFGTVNGKLAFCSDCETAVKKLDIISGW